MKWKSPHNRILPSPRGIPLVMGILNVGAQSFSDGGKYSDTDAALRHAEEMIASGADIIDIGAESTRPQAKKLPERDELEILLPKLSALRKRFPDIPVSVDTYKPEVAKIAVSEGADIVNDVYVIRENGHYPMAATAAKIGAPLVLTHCCRGENVVGDFFEFFMKSMSERLQNALNEGLPRDMIVLDAGVGFGKTAQQNFGLVRNLARLRKFGCPVLLGVSRKSMFAETAGDSLAARDAATVAVSVFAALEKSCDILRVHDVAANVAALKTISKLF